MTLYLKFQNMCLSLCFTMCFCARSWLWFPENYQHPDRLYLLSLPNLMPQKESKTNLLGKYHMDHRRLISFQEWDIQRGKKEKKSKSCLSWKQEKIPGEGQHFSVLWLAMNLKHCPGWGSQVPSEQLHWEQRDKGWDCCSASFKQGVLLPHSK